MNIEYFQTSNPLKVFVVNPLAKASKLTIVKMLSGTMFGQKQMINLILLVYTNEIALAQAFKLQLMDCAFSCVNSVEISSGLPRYLHKN